MVTELIKYPLLFIVVFYSCFGFAQTDSWKNINDTKEGTVTINYYNSENFISDASGKLSGLEYELLESFFTFCENTYALKVTRNYTKSSSFSTLYNNIKSSTDSGEFAACSFSMTDQRLS